MELRESRQVRDKTDVSKLLNWLYSHNPFDGPTDLLISLSTGGITDNTVNCDEALSRGLDSIKSIEGQRFNEVHLKRQNKVTTFASDYKTTKIKDAVVEINPNQLFHRLLCAVCDDNDLE